jgi:hypothetical protein
MLIPPLSHENHEHHHEYTDDAESSTSKTLNEQSLVVFAIVSGASTEVINEATKAMIEIAKCFHGGNSLSFGIQPL